MFGFGSYNSGNMLWLLLLLLLLSRLLILFSSCRPVVTGEVEEVDDDETATVPAGVLVASVAAIVAK